MLQKIHIRRWLIAIAGGLTVSLLISFFSFSADCAQIRESVFRLHILANSDSAADQALKLKVRDSVTAEAAGLFDAAQDRQDAIDVARAHLPELQQAAEQRIKAEGYDYPVKVEIVNMYFTTRVYDSGTLPAGMYDALRVIIGKGAGHNWWCVVFPPICVPAATKDAKTLDDVLSAKDAKIVTQPQKYEIRFKAVEVAESVWHTVSGWFS